MAQISTPSTGVENLPSAPPNPATIVSAAPVQDGEEDSDEWEYEYSATETETYYVTLDLTNPNLNADKPTRRYRGKVKGHVRTRWTNPGLGRNRPGRYLKPVTYGAITGGNEVDNTPEADAEIEDDEDVEDDEPAGENGTRPSSPEEDETAETAEISIIDLHTDNPLISYKGSIFSCEWAKNVGTELLFVAHDRDSTLPILKKLPGGVDLLAASSARILSTPVELESRKRKRSPVRTFERGSRLEQRQRMIPVGIGAFDKRKDQATFLENFINIKQDKGEEDSVTIVAEKRLSNSKWRARLQVLRQRERKELMSITHPNRKNQDPEAVANAKQRLQQMDDEDQEMSILESSVPKRRNPPKNTAGRKAKGMVGADAAMARRVKRGRPKNEVYASASYSGLASPNVEGVDMDAIEDDDEEEDLYSAQEDVEEDVDADAD